MGTTSAFHEGGDHVAIRSGKLAGRLAAEGRLNAYNDAWKAAIGKEIVRNVTVAELVRRYTPQDWDRSFAVLREMGFEEGSLNYSKLLSRSGLEAFELYGRSFWHHLRFRGGRYTQLREDEYVYG
jgi:electron-transferring-flavoprotein dehydrogenase